jgi:hypothetical protein
MDLCLSAYSAQHSDMSAYTERSLLRENTKPSYGNSFLSNQMCTLMTGMPFNSFS